MPAVISVIGIGTGSMDYLLPAALKKVQAAEVLIGSRKALTMFNDLPGKDVFELTGRLEEAIEYIEKIPSGKGIAVLVTGDPGFYSFLNYLKKCLPERKFEVIPGISSVQVAMARLQSSWHDACLISLHGRRRENLPQFISEQLSRRPRVIILTDSGLTPDAIARTLLEGGFPDQEIHVLSDLTMPSEAIKKVSLRELAGSRESGNSVVVFGNVR